MDANLVLASTALVETCVGLLDDRGRDEWVIAVVRGIGHITLIFHVNSVKIAEKKNDGYLDID